MSVSINIPGVGTVSAPNAASESTLRQLVQAVSAQQQRASRADRELASATQTQAKLAANTADSLNQLAASAKSSETASRNLFHDLERNIQRASTVGSGITDSSAGEYLKRLGTIAATTGQSIAKMAGDVPRDAIKSSEALLRTGTNLLIDGIGIIPKLMSKGLPPALSTAIGKLTDSSANLMKDVSGILISQLSDELNTTTRSFREMNQMGVSFADGMTEMRKRSFDAGLTVDQFSSAMRKSEPSLKAFGQSTSLAIERVSNVSKTFGTAMGSTNKTLRQELMNLGYSLEEQTELAAEYMAQQRAAMTQQEFNSLGQEELARGTRKYAEDLKVLRDVTGQDAKAARERARTEVQRAGLLNKLGPEQKKSFEASFAVMNKLPANIQNALINRIMGQPITDPTIAMSEELMTMIENIAQGIQSGNKDMQKVTLQEVALAQERVKKMGAANEGMYAQADQLSALNVGGLTADFARTINAFILDAPTEEQIKAAYANAKQSADTTNTLTNTVTTLQLDLANLQKTFSENLTPLLAPFGSALKEATGLIQDVTLATGRVVTGKQPPKNSPPGTEATEPYSGLQYLSDLADTLDRHLSEPLKTIGGRLIEALGGLLQAAPQETPSPQARFSDAVDRFGTAVAGLGRFLPSAASGGILEGPSSGYLAMLHGKEAVIPLGDGNSVNLKSSNNTATSQLAPGDSVEPLGQKIDNLFNSPNLMTNSLSDLKNIMASSGQTTQSLLSLNIEKMDALISKLDENVTYSRRIANDIA